MLLDFGLISSVLSGYFRRRKEAKKLRQEHAHQWVENRIKTGRLGMRRAKLAKMQRGNPLSVPAYPIPLDEDGIICVEAYCLDK